MTPSPDHPVNQVALGVQLALYQWRNHTHSLRGNPVHWTGPPARKSK